MSYLMPKLDLFQNVCNHSYIYTVPYNFLNYNFEKFVYNHLLAQNYMITIIPIIAHSCIVLGFQVLNGGGEYPWLSG